jgi:hypothetical protein
MSERRVPGSHSPPSKAGHARLGPSYLRHNVMDATRHGRPQRGPPSLFRSDDTTAVGAPGRQQRRHSSDGRIAHSAATARRIARPFIGAASNPAPCTYALDPLAPPRQSAHQRLPAAISQRRGLASWLTQSHCPAQGQYYLAHECAKTEWACALAASATRSPAAFDRRVGTRLFHRCATVSTSSWRCAGSGYANPHADKVFADTYLRSIAPLGRKLCYGLAACFWCRLTCFDRPMTAAAMDCSSCPPGGPRLLSRWRSGSAVGTSLARLAASSRQESEPRLSQGAVWLTALS